MVWSDPEIQDEETVDETEEETPTEGIQWRIPPGEFGYPGGVL